jgi:hypothetical protein
MITETDQSNQLSNTNLYPFKFDLENKKIIYIYQIFLKDLSIKENYIGQTECFETRKYAHCRDSKVSNLKIYKIIRQYGGWDNFEMKIMNYYHYREDYEIRQIEQKYIDIFKPTMNSVRACPKDFINEKLDRELEFELNDYSDKILGCFLYDYFLFDYSLYLNYKVDQELLGFICEYCKNVFYNKSNLQRHQRTSKTCIEIQTKNNITNSSIKLFICKFCNKNLSSKHSLAYHLKICKCQITTNEKGITKLFENRVIINKPNKTEINELKNMINKLQEEINEIKNIPITANNNIDTATNINTLNNNNTFDNKNNNIDFMSYMTSEKIKDVFDNYYNIKVLLGSKESLAHFVINNFLSGSDKPIYLCSDKQRKKFYFFDKNKKIDDSNVQILINLILNNGFGSIKNTYNKHIKTTEENHDKLDIALNDIKNLKRNNKEFINELIKYLPKTVEERKILDQTKFIDCNSFELEEIKNI